MDNDNQSISSQSTNYSIKAKLQNGNLVLLYSQGWQKKFHLAIKYLLSRVDYILQFDSLMNQNSIVELYKTHFELMTNLMNSQNDLLELAKLTSEICKNQQEQQEILLQFSTEIQDNVQFYNSILQMLKIFLSQANLCQNREINMKEELKQFHIGFIEALCQNVKKKSQLLSLQCLSRSLIQKIQNQNNNLIQFLSLDKNQTFSYLEELVAQAITYRARCLHLAQKFKWMGLEVQFTQYKQLLLDKYQKLISLANHIKKQKNLREVQKKENQLLIQLQQFIKIQQKIQNKLQNKNKIQSNYKTQIIHIIKKNFTTKIEFMQNKQQSITQIILELIQSLQHNIRFFLSQKQFQKLRFHKEVYKIFKKAYQIVSSEQNLPQSLAFKKRKIQKVGTQLFKFDKKVNINFLQHMKNKFFGVLSQHQQIKSMILLFFDQLAKQIYKIKDIFLKKQIILKVLSKFQKDAKLQKSINSPESSQNSKILQIENLKQQEKQINKYNRPQEDMNKQEKNLIQIIQKEENLLYKSNKPQKKWINTINPLKKGEKQQEKQNNLQHVTTIWKIIKEDFKLLKQKRYSKNRG